MQNAQAQIKEFMFKAAQAVPDRPTWPIAEVRALRVRLIAEELIELATAFHVNLRIDTDGGQDIPVARVEAKSDTLIPRLPDMVGAYDAILDLLVVVIGAGISMGTELEPGWQEVHRTNMEKFKGGKKRADGKWLKPENWQPPNLAAILDSQQTQHSLT